MRVQVALSVVAPALCLAAGLGVLGCNTQPSQGGAGAGGTKPVGSASATTAASANSAAEAPPARPSVRRRDPGNIPTERDPMGAYTREVVNKYDPRSACLAGCAAALRCKHESIFGGGGVEVGDRLKACRNACNGAGPKAPAYLEQTKACLASGSCESFTACSNKVLLAPR